jgi:hypothetical protein
VRISTAELLDAWRAAERGLGVMEPGSPDEIELTRVRDDARELYRERFDQINGHGSFDSDESSPGRRNWSEISADEVGS